MNCYRKAQRNNLIEIKENHAEIIINSTKYGIQKVLIDKEDIPKVCPADLLEVKAATNMLRLCL